MRHKCTLTFLLCFLMILVSFTQSMANDPAALAKESEAYCKATAMDRPTPPDIIIAKVSEACALLQAEGTAAFPKFKGKGSNFLYEGTYVWIHNLEEAKMLMHPIKNKMEGNNYASLKDKNGKRFFVIMNKMARENGSAWIEYYWPQPGTNEIIRKISYVKKCMTADGIEVVVGSGLYNYSEADIAKLKIY